jgi:hypothetical protein
VVCQSHQRRIDVRNRLLGTLIEPRPSFPPRALRLRFVAFFECL